MEQKNSKRKILLLIILIVLSFWIIAGGIFSAKHGSSRDVIKEAVEKGNLEVCDKIPFWFYRTCSGVGGMGIPSFTSICNLKKECS